MNVCTHLRYQEDNFLNLQPNLMSGWQLAQVKNDTTDRIAFKVQVYYRFSNEAGLKFIRL